MPRVDLGLVVGGAEEIKTFTAAEFAALTTAEKIALHESGVRVIVAGGYGYTLDSAGTATPVNAADAQTLGGKPASDFVQTSNVVNNFTTTEEGFVADARTVKELNDNVSGLGNGIPATMRIVTVSASAATDKGLYLIPTDTPWTTFVLAVGITSPTNKYATGVTNTFTGYDKAFRAYNYDGSPYTEELQAIAVCVTVDN